MGEADDSDAKIVLCINSSKAPLTVKNREAYLTDGFDARPSFREVPNSDEPLAVMKVFPRKNKRRKNSTQIIGYAPHQSPL